MNRHSSALTAILSSILILNCHSQSQPASAEVSSASKPLPAWTRAKTKPPENARQFKIETKIIEITSPAGTTKIPKKAYQKVLSPAEMQNYMRTLSQRKGADIMTSPSVVTPAGQAAKIENGQEFIYPSGYEPTVFKTELIGVSQYFRVRPLNEDGDLTLDAVIAVTENAGFKTPEKGIPQPIFHKRRIDETIKLSRNKTVLLGGLVTDKEQVVEDSVPVLGDIPLIGNAFTRRKNMTFKSELIVLITLSEIDRSGNPIR